MRREAPIGYLALAAFLILLSKLNVYGLLPFGVVIALGLWLSHRSRRSRANRRPWWVVAGAVAAGIGLLALTLFVLLPLLNNIALVARINQFVHSLTNRRLWKAVPWEIWDETLLYGSKTFWASFGWGNLEAPAWTYTASAVAALIALFGLAAALARSGSRDRHLFAGVGLLLAGLLGAISVPYFFALFRRNLNLFPGRYLLSALTPVSILLALGIASWWRGRWRSVSLVGLAAGLFVLSASFPFTVIAPAYRPPALLEASVESAITHSLYNDFGIEILLVGYDVNDSNSRPGGEVALTLYWKALAPIDKNYTLNVIAVSPQGRNYATHRAYPGHGNFATTLWKPGDFFRDTYVLPIPADALGPAVGQFRVGFDLPDGQNAFPDAFLTANLFGEFKVAAPPPTGTGEGLSSPTPTSYRMGNVITLKGYTLAPSASSLDLTLFWHADQSRAGNWMVSLALLDSRGKIVAQGDGPPLSGAYPTRWWDAGEQIMDPHYLVLPTGLPCGNYQLVFGLYDSTTLARLPITGDGPLTVKDNLFWLDVSPAAPLCGP